MTFQKTGIEGAWLVQVEKQHDERGFFARTWCKREFSQLGLSDELVQCSIAHNRVKGTMRGMHFQREPYAECKLVRCTMGAVYDVIIDLRPASPTYKRHFGVELTAASCDALFVPRGCAHGYLTLADDAELFYQMSQFYSPAHAAGVRWNDPAFGVAWPAPVRVISRRDAEYPDFMEAK